MAVSYGKAVKNSLKFSIVPEKVAVFTLVSLVTFALIFIPVLEMLQGTISVATGIYLAVGVIVGVILGVVITAGTIHNYPIRKNPLHKSLIAAKSRYVAAFLAMIFIVILSSILGFIPYLGSIAGLIVSIIFFFIMQEAVLTKNKLKKIIGVSWGLFRNNMGTVIITWLITIVISSIIVGIFSIPLLVMLFKTISLSTLTGLTQETMITMFTTALKENMLWYAIGGIFFLIGSSISKLFGLGLATDIWQQIKKK